MVAVGLLLVPALAAAAPPIHYGDAGVWDHFAILVWQYKTPAPGPDAAAAYARLNLRGVWLNNMA